MESINAYIIVRGNKAFTESKMDYYEWTNAGRKIENHPEYKELVKYVKKCKKEGYSIAYTDAKALGKFKRILGLPCIVGVINHFYNSHI